MSVTKSIDFNNDSDEENERLAKTMERLKIDNKIKIYLGSRSLRLFKHPVEKVNVYKGKLCSSYVLKEVGKENPDKADINKMLNEKKTLFVQNSIVNNYKNSIATKTPKKIKSVTLSTIISPKAFFEKKSTPIFVKSKGLPLITNFMNKKDFYY